MGMIVGMRVSVLVSVVPMLPRRGPASEPGHHVDEAFCVLMVCSRDRVCNCANRTIFQNSDLHYVFAHLSLPPCSVDDDCRNCLLPYSKSVVFILLLESCPFAVLWSVVPIVILAMDTQSLWAFAHVGKKLVVIVPSSTDPNTTASIATIVRLVFICASGTHCAPNAISACSFSTQ